MTGRDGTTAHAEYPARRRAARHRRLSASRRLRGIAQGARRHDAGGGDRRGNGVESARPRRRRLPDRARNGAWRRPTAMRRAKYLVVNADEMEPGTLQGPAADGGRSAPADRRRSSSAPSRSRRASPTSSCAPNTRLPLDRLAARDRRGAAPKAISARTSWARASTWSSICTAAPGAISAASETRAAHRARGPTARSRARSRPTPQVSGLWGKPTVVNNVETLCNVPHIVNRGADWFRGLPQREDGGTKIYGAQRPGEAAGRVGAADGHDDPRNPRGACRRNARWL